ncbi:hypothetical protein [Candidiatus Paracoxiella cheracis]|uniref:hypothetical protein n=1 Tax=Candidiatus Paracoxiella cheracis TaxID=3405120 RepID=UPI003BF49EFA
MKGRIVKITWQDVRQDVKSVNPSLAKIIDRLAPDDTFPLYKASYPFGATIVNHGLFYIPLENGDLVPINSSNVDEILRSDLEYAENGIPVGTVLKNSYEVFVTTSHFTLPIITTIPGSIFALWKQLDPHPTFHPVKIFNITAGARSIFMLPNIGDTMLHKNLKRDFNVCQQPPKNLNNQWEIFKTIAKHERSDWQVELLLIPGKWIEKAKTDLMWHELYLYLLENAWVTSGYERNQIFYQFALSCTQASRNLKPNPYLLDTVQHLLSVTLGATPGFTPAMDNTFGPIELIQQAYLSSYGLKRYAPTIMHPIHFNIQDENASPVYYSLQFPTTISFSPRSRKLSSTLHDLRELKYILDIFIEEISEKVLPFDNTILEAIPRLVEYEYFHSKPDKHSEILLTDEMVSDDPRLSSTLCEASSMEFSANGTFIRGCVRIART